MDLKARPEATMDLKARPEATMDLKARPEATMDQELKEINREKYRIKSKKYKKGKRGPSPFYRLQGKIDKRLQKKQDQVEDFAMNDKHIKLIKKY